MCAAPAHGDPGDSLVEVVDAAAERLLTADPVAAVKWRSGTAIEDPARVQQQLAAVGAAADTEGLDPEYLTRIFGDQIAATEAIEYSRFAQWKLEPSAVPAAPPDLSGLRADLDRLNQVMLTRIGQRWELLASAQCAAALAGARRAVGDTRRLDDLHQRALAYATQSYCRP